MDLIRKFYSYSWRKIIIDPFHVSKKDVWFPYSGIASENYYMGCEKVIITFVKMIKMLSVCMWSMQPFLRCLSFIVQWDWLISIVSSLYHRRRYQGGLIRLQLDSCLVWQRRLLIHLKKGLRFRLQLRLRLSLSVVIACSMRCSWIVSYAHKCPTHEILWLCSCRIGMGSFWALF